MYLPTDAGSGPTGCPPRYLHTDSKTDPVKSLMVTSPISSGKQNEIQMEVSQLAVCELELDKYWLKAQFPHL